MKRISLFLLIVIAISLIGCSSEIAEDDAVDSSGGIASVVPGENHEPPTEPNENIVTEVEEIPGIINDLEKTQSGEIIKKE